MYKRQHLGYEKCLNNKQKEADHDKGSCRLIKDAVDNLIENRTSETALSIGKH